MRLERWVAQRASWSRKEARRAIRRGRVAIEGEVVRDPATQVDPEAAIAIDGEAPAPLLDLAVFHKPIGVQSTVGDPRGRASLAEVAADLLGRGLHPVGRLDADSEGLLLFCRDGQITQQLLHPRHGVEKVYVAEVEGPVPDDLGARLAAGVETGTGVHAARLVAAEGTTVTLAVHEGKHRMVRRMLANVGCPVQRLVRTGFGAIALGDLEPGTWRAPTAAESAWLDGLRR